jgi:type IV secretion system protein TrbL
MAISISTKALRTAAALALLLVSCDASAQGLSASGVLNYVADSFINSASGYAASIKNAAERLFWILLAISIVVTGIKLVFKQGDPASFFAVLIRLCLLTGTFYFLLSHGTAIGTSIIDSLMSVTSRGSVGPSEILDCTFNTTHALNKSISSSISNLPTALVLQLMILFFTVTMFLVTVRYVTLYITAYIFCVCGVFVLGFGAFSYTREISVSYLRVIFSLALELMTMILICNAGFEVLSGLAGQIADLDRPLIMQDAGVVLFIALFIYALTARLPSIVGSLVATHPDAGTVRMNIPIVSRVLGH